MKPLTKTVFQLVVGTAFVSALLILSDNQLPAGLEALINRIPGQQLQFLAVWCAFVLIYLPIATAMTKTWMIRDPLTTDQKNH